MITEAEFARDEARLGKAAHFHMGRWWVRAAPFYCKPVHEFRPIRRGESRPSLYRSFLGFSHQVPDGHTAVRHLAWQMITNDSLRTFDLRGLRPEKQRAVRKGLRECQVTHFEASPGVLEQMREINIQQARRFAEAGETGTFLPAEYYERHKERWRAEISRFFSHRGHEFLGAFVGDVLAAYVDLIRIEDTWMFGAVKSRTDMLGHRPVDALYFSILSMAAASGECNRVVNGGPERARESLIRFKEGYGLTATRVPYFGRSLLPVDQVKLVARRLMIGRRRAQHEGDSQQCVESRDS